MCDICTLVGLVFLLICKDVAVGFDVCDLNVILDDDGGDGWNHNYISITGENGRILSLTDADGETQNHGALPYGAHAIYSLQNVTDGETLTVHYSPVGKWPTENEWSIVNTVPQSPVLLQGRGSLNATTSQLVVSCCCVPETPTNLAIQVLDEPYFALVSWDAVFNAEVYIVQWRVNNTNFWKPFGKFNTSFVTIFLPPLTNLTFQVAAISNFSQGNYSESVSVESGDYETCQVKGWTFDNLGDMDNDHAYLAVYVDEGLELFQAFDSKSSQFNLVIPANGSFQVSTVLVQDDDSDPSDKEFLFRFQKKVLIHSGGTFGSNNSFTVNCSSLALEHPRNLLSMGTEERIERREQKLLSMEFPSLNLTAPDIQLQATCYYVLLMNDTAGNGWSQGMSITISLNGQSWATNLSVPQGDAWYYWSFWINEPTVCALTFNRGQDPDPTQASYRVATYNNNVVGATIVTSGGSNTIPGNTQFTANCTGGASSGSCPSTATCASFNRNNCQTSFNPKTCGTCLSGFTASDGSTSSNSNSPCASSGTCPTSAICTSFNRNPCQTSFSPRTCGTCLSGFSASDGTTNSHSNSLCSTTQTCPASTTCASLNRNACSGTNTTCGTCLTGYQTTAGNTTRGNTQCNDINECLNSPCDTNAKCTNTVGTFTCVCNSGFTGNGKTCAQQGCGQRIRQEWFGMSAQQKDQWVRATQLIYSRGMAATLVQMHSTNAPFAHGTAMFFYWHRPFVAMYEDTMRSLGGEFACMTQPYWDWTNSDTRQQIFTNALQGSYRIGVGVKDGKCFSGANPFAGLSFNGQCVYRTAMTTPTTLPTPQGMASMLNTNLYSTVRPLVESQHNNLHNWVGGNMALVPTSPQDPVFWVHHSFVDQIFASWQMCQGNINMSPFPPSNINLVWESGAGVAQYTQTMPGWTVSPSYAWNLGNYNVLYQRTWFQAAFPNPAQACPKGTQIWLQAFREEEENYVSPASLSVSDSNKDKNVMTQKHLMGLVNSNSHSHSNSTGGKKKKYKIRSHYKPSKVFLAQQQAIYETMKDTFLTTNNVTLALDKAFVKSCLMQPQITAQQAQLFTPEEIIMMNLEEECAAGYCVDWCWKRTQNL